MFLKVAIETDDDDTIAAIHKFGAQFPVAGNLGRFIMHGAIAEHAHVWSVKIVREATRFGNGFLRLVRQAVESGGKGIQKTALNFGA